MIPIFKNAGVNLIGVEVGVDKGKNIKYLLDNCPNIRKIYGIDPWTEYPALDQGNCNKNYLKALLNLRSYFLDDNAEILKTHSLKAVKKFRDGSLDFAYIDGDHRYLQVVMDLNAWYPKVKPGGIFSGHDYRPEDTDVRKAVRTFCNGINQTQIDIAMPGHSWYFRKRGS